MSGSLGALVRKELREARWRLAVAVLLLVGFGAFVGPLYDIVGGYMGLIEDMHLPQWIVGPMRRQMGDLLLYLWANWYGKNLLQTIAILSAIYGAGLIAGETARKTSGFLFSRPVSRRSVLLVKYGVNLGILAGAAIAGTVAVGAGSRWAGHGSHLDVLALGLPAMLAGTAMLLALATLFSVGSDDPTKVMALSFAVIVALFLVGSWEPLAWASPFERMAAGRTFMSRSVIWTDVALMLGVAVALLGAAWAWLERREL